MKVLKFLVILSLCSWGCTACEDPGPPIADVGEKLDPPFSGTIFLDGDIITSSDPTTYTGLTDAGKEARTMYDRRANDWVQLEPWLFNASYDDGLSIEMQVNPEFGTQDQARVEAEKYAEVIGRLPTSLRKDVETSWIHKGVNPFGGGNRNLLIHVGQADLYVNDGILEETLVHEASHTSLDAEHAKSEGWKAAQEEDPAFISTYARDNPEREDIAESFLLYLALRHRGDRISQELKDDITVHMSARVEYFDSLNLDMYPIAK